MICASTEERPLRVYALGGTERGQRAFSIKRTPTICAAREICKDNPTAFSFPQYFLPKKKKNYNNNN